MAKKKQGTKAQKSRPSPSQPSHETLVEALGDENDAIRAVDALGQLRARGGPRLTALLVDLATNSEDIDLRASAAQTMGGTPSAKHRTTLVSVLNDPEPEVARRAAEALAAIGGEAELKKLRAVRTSDQVVRRSVDMAKTLLSYRTGSTRGRLPIPRPGEMLKLGLEKARPIALQAADPEMLAGIGEHLKKILPTLPLAGSAHTIACGKAEYLLVWHKDLGRKNFDKLTNGSSIMGALLRKAQIDGTYYLDGHVLAHPGAGNSVRMFVMRGSGEVSHCGELILGAKAARFSIAAMNTRHTKPLILEGELQYKTLEVETKRAQVAVARASVQPSAKRPRQIQIRTAVS